MNDLSLEASAFLAAVVTWSLYGCYTCLFAVCMRVLYWRKQQNRWVIMGLVGLYVFVTLHVCLYSTYIYDAFVVNLRAGKTVSYLSLYHRPIIGADYLSYWICVGPLRLISDQPYLTAVYYRILSQRL
ncbi:hypothetical protein M407DRAFT_110826 [Tulasnella calospora MUT 4182]|uniref:Uncharacterized protein n=1 Tax=Tulasnella calospora MUT 4182 TaxID=1051891 RepID=A0A0C3LPG6_9AGAM|nr:hypothetical protein M407DRAFT_110826 [Tulasnella calospora MUT 4182]